jgi:hypothetical protein
MRTLKISSLHAQDIFSHFRTPIFQLCKGFTIASACAMFGGERPTLKSRLGIIEGVISTKNGGRE